MEKFLLSGSDSEGRNSVKGAFEPGKLKAFWSKQRLERISPAAPPASQKPPPCLKESEFKLFLSIFMPLLMFN
ncbi:hypothetical protein [Saccharibacillus endophyticus]|uniref:hypothetical protein n=1 Tax=Saccharibacillus endophyticus TaxID=2060666 RepID=UPI0015549444|nr:hypothetical protein [Saccharibacillus endophyticus]